jgi:hypothetical protein
VVPTLLGDVLTSTVLGLRPKLRLMEEGVKIPRKSLLPVAFLTLFTSLAFSSAPDIYITSDGSAQGACTSDPHPASFFNSSSNWGSGSSQIGSGTTVHLCGTISTALNAQGNGSSGNPVTILFEPGAKLSTAVFPVNGALNLSNRSWIVVDGGTPCGPAVSDKNSCNGTIENTDNGTSFGHHTDQTVGININGSSNVTVQNILVQNIYVHTSTSDTNVPGQPLPVGVNAWSSGATNFTMHDSTLHDANWMFSFIVNNGSAISNIELYRLDVYNSDHCFAVGISSGTTSGFSLHDSHCHDGANWDTTANYYHHDGIHLYGTAGGTHIVNVQIYNNVFDGNWGVNNTAAIFEEGPGGGEVSSTIYNNFFGQNGYNFSWNNGFINLGNLAGSNPSVTKLYNNTAIAGSGMAAYMWQLAYAVDVRNNVLVTSNTSQGLTLGLLGSVTGTVDYNTYASPSSCTFQINGSGCKSFSQWQALGWDAHAPSGTPGKAPFNLNANTGVPSSGFIGLGAGADLTSLGIAALDRDKSGTLRAASGSWDIGAYANGSGNSGSAQQPPDPPTGLTASVD